MIVLLMLGGKYRCGRCHKNNRSDTIQHALGEKIGNISVIRMIGAIR